MYGGVYRGGGVLETVSHIAIILPLWIFALPRSSNQSKSGLAKLVREPKLGELRGEVKSLECIGKLEDDRKAFRMHREEVMEYGF